LKIKKKEKDKKSVIPFLSILVENLKDEEIAVSYDQYRDVEYKNPLGFLMVMMIFLFFFMATGKQIKYSENIGNIKKRIDHRYQGTNYVYSYYIEHEILNSKSPKLPFHFIQKIIHRILLFFICQRIISSIARQSIPNYISLTLISL